MRLPEHRIPWKTLQAVALGRLHLLDGPAGCFDEGPLMLVELRGHRCVEVVVSNVRIHTGAVDRLTVKLREAV